MKRRVKSAPSAIKILLPIVTVLLSAFFVFSKITPVEGHGGGCGNSCQERTVYKHKDWKKDGHWECAAGWSLYYSDSFDEWKCKKFYMGGWHFQDPIWIDTSHWRDWSSWSNTECVPSEVRQCQSKKQHKVGCGDWINGECPIASPTPTNTPTCTPTLTPIPEEPVYHYVCIEYSCVQVEGEGENDCEVDEECRQSEISPTPTQGEEISPTPTVEVTPTSEPARGGSSEEPKAPVCGDTAPSAPVLLSVTRQSAGSVIVKWQKVTPANHYSIMYGPKSGDYPYSVFDTGDVDSFVINGMNSGCFAVKASNGCAPGPLSNEVCLGGVVGGGQVLGASTMAGTGSSSEVVQYVMFVLGTIIAGFGVRKLSPKAI